MRCRSVLAGALFAAATAAGCGPPVKPACALPDPQDAGLVALLADGHFTELEAKLRAYTNAAERDPACDAYAMDAYSTGPGGPDNPNALADLDAFVDAHPASFVPFAVRGNWWVNAGYAARGTKWIRDTTDEQIAAMRAAFAHAEPDLLRAIELNPASGSAYVDLVRMLQARGDHAGVYAAARAGAEALPLSHRILIELLLARSPKWGGSRTEQASIAFRAWARTDENPRMAAVPAWFFTSLGDDHWHDDRWFGGLCYDLALRFDDSPVFWERRMRARNIAGDFDGAIADAREFLAREPKSEKGWKLLVSVHQQRLDWRGAVREADAAVAALPGSILLLEMRAYSLSKARQFDLAEADYLRLMEIDPGSEHSQAYSRFLVDEKRADYDRAILVMQEAVARDPNDAENWSHLAAAQYMVHDPALRASYQKFVDLVDTSVPENAQRKRDIQAFLDSGGGMRARSGRIPPAEAARLREAAR